MELLQELGFKFVLKEEDIKDMTQKKLEALHEILANVLTERICEGDSAPALLNVARQFLRDNGVESLPVEESHLSDLLKTMPTFDEEEECQRH